MPARFYTKGYTGEKKTNQRFYIFKNEDLSNAINGINSLFEKDFAEPMKFNQYFRCQTFVLIDTILASFFASQKVIKTAEFNLVLKLINSFLAAYNKWLDLIPALSNCVFFASLLKFIKDTRFCERS